MPPVYKPLIFITSLIAAASLVLGPYLFFKVEDTADATSELICSLGKVISKSPIIPRPEETPAEFRVRANLVRHFARDLRHLDDCEGKTIRVKIPPESQDILDDARRNGEGRKPTASDEGPNESVGSEGGGSASAGSPPSSPPSPGGGSDGTASVGTPGGTQPPPNPPAPPGPQGPQGPPGPPPTPPPSPEPQALLDPVTEPLEPVTGPLGVECELNALGLRICG